MKFTGTKSAKGYPMNKPDDGIAAPNDWPEDFPQENGYYSCRCCECNKMFYGHKRRVVCKVCAAPAQEADEDVYKEIRSVCDEKLAAFAAENESLRRDLQTSCTEE